ncbi:hypothetical protein MMC24_005520 [Lignoscripta atroalba]|nr:hypothetical protein [Lignoscripta atroalba]
MPTSNLPTPRSFLTSLFAELKGLTISTADTQPTNPLKNATSETKALFLTLHCLFPNEFLPALDLLDRQLLTRCVITSGQREASAALNETIEGDRNVVYYVRSSQPMRASRYHSNAAMGGISYEVRLKAWNCSCPAFTFSAFNGLDVHHGSTSEEGTDLSQDCTGREREWRFGGLMLDEEGLPVCKHLLACVLAERCGVLATYVEEKVVSRDEAAGWAAGWGG